MELFCTATKSVFSILRAFLGIDLVFCIIKTVNVSAVASAVVVVDDDVEACSSAATTSATISAFIVSIITVTAVITRDVVF